MRRLPTSDIDYCPWSGKVKYDKLKQARTVLNNIKRNERNAAARSVYKCTHCSAYHLTSLTVEEYRERENKIDYEFKYTDKFNKFIKQDDETLGRSTIQIDIGDEKRPSTRSTSRSVVPLLRGLRAQASSGELTMEQKFKLYGDAVRQGRKRPIQTDGKGGCERNKIPGVPRTRSR